MHVRSNWLITSRIKYNYTIRNNIWNMWCISGAVCSTATLTPGSPDWSCAKVTVCMDITLEEGGGGVCLKFSPIFQKHANR